MENKKELDVLDLLIILAKKKWFIFWVTFIVSIGAVIYSLVTPEIWSSSATFKYKNSSSLNLSSLGGGILSGFSSQLGLSSDNSVNEIVTVMQSKDFVKDIIDKYDFINYFEIDFDDVHKNYFVAREKYLKKVFSVWVDNETGFIHFSIRTKDRARSVEIANYIYNKIEKYLIESDNLSAKEQRIFYGQKIDEYNKLINQKAEEFAQFQKENNFFATDAQISETLQMYSNLINNKLETELKLNVENLFVQNEAMKEKNSLILESIEKIQKSILGEDSSFYNGIPTLNAIPELARVYLSKETEIQFYYKVLEILYPQYELYKLEEDKNISKLKLIERPIIAGVRVKPKRAIICIVMFLIAIIFSSSAVLFNHFFFTDDNKRKSKQLIGILFNA